MNDDRHKSKYVAENFDTIKERKEFNVLAIKQCYELREMIIFFFFQNRNDKIAAKIKRTEKKKKSHIARSKSKRNFRTLKILSY